jgi:ADP-ribose pyrophosphatase YjhB (NUDIX family)
MPRIRTIALCVFRRGGRILAGHGYDRVKKRRFLRPVGGGVEFGERAEDALRREIREELDAEIRNPRLLGVLENVFTYAASPGHEIVFIFDAEFEDASLYEREKIDVREGERDKTATWISLDALDEAEPLYPDGLRALLRETARRP